jgi:hypothetical protein
MSTRKQEILAYQKAYNEAHREERRAACLERQKRVRELYTLIKEIVKKDLIVDLPADYKQQILELTLVDDL